MAYYLDLFSPDTYEAFLKSDRAVSGFRLRQQNAANKIHPGDKFICYITKLSRWFGILEVTSENFTDTTPLFVDENDPFIVRFKVRPIVVLSQEKAVPIREEQVWNTLSFTKGQSQNTSSWTRKLRGSLIRIDDKDAKFLESALLGQSTNDTTYSLKSGEYERLLTHKVRASDKMVTVSVPQDSSDIDDVIQNEDVRESTKVQAMIACIGAKMGMRIWLPKNDRSAVLGEWKDSERSLLDVLPINYDSATIKTIEQIDVLWMKGRSIVRAFEVEHTTSIYSGILRMADLLALQPNINIKLHIVAPIFRRDKVFQELLRPVFRLLDNGALSDCCTYLSYDSLAELSKQKHLDHLSDSVLDEYSEEAE